MAFPNVPGGEGYIRANFTGNAEAESVENYLNNLHPEVATAHALFAQETVDSVAPTVLLDDSPINRTSTAASALVGETRSEGAAIASWGALDTPDRLFNRMQIFSEGVAASRTSQRIRMYGIEDTMDRAITRALTKVLDQNERAMHFGVGIGTGATRMHGLLTWCASTGLERRHGTPAASVLDGLSMNTVAGTFYSSMYNGLNTILSRDVLYDQVFGTGWDLGHQIDGSIILCGRKMMKLFADLPHQPGRSAINERDIPARDKAMVDVLTMIEAPGYGTFMLMLDRIMSIPGVNIDFANNGGGGAPALGGSIASGAISTISVDKTILSVMPSEFRIKAIDPIHYKELASDGDYSAGSVTSEKTLGCEHPYGVIGGGNLNT